MVIKKSIQNWSHSKKKHNLLNLDKTELDLATLQTQRFKHKDLYKKKFITHVALLL